MGAFANDLRCHRISDHPQFVKRYKLDGPLIYVDLPKTHVVVPKGFITDGASVPRALWFAVPPAGKTFRGAIIHDYLGHRLVNLKRPYRGFETQKAIDDLFLQIMTEDGVPLIQRQLMYRTLRLVAKHRRLP